MSEQGSGGKKFLTAKEVAARYGMSLFWVYHCPEMQEIRRKIGKRHVVWAIEDLEVLERTDRDKATGGKTLPLDRARQTAIEEAEKRLKFTIQ